MSLFLGLGAGSKCGVCDPMESTTAGTVKVDRPENHVLALEAGGRIASRTREVPGTQMDLVIDHLGSAQFELFTTLGLRSKGKPDNLGHGVKSHSPVTHVDI